LANCRLLQRQFKGEYLANMLDNSPNLWLATEIVIPPMPVLSQTFITDDNRIAILKSDLEESAKSLNVNPSILSLNLIALWIPQFVIVAQ
jgi:hypothetical protein